MTILFKQRFFNYIRNKPEMEKIVFVWVPRHVDIRENSAADSAVMDALNDDTSDELTPFSDLKPPLNKYLLGLWQLELDECPENKLHRIVPKLNDRVSCPRTNRREETVISRLHTAWSLIYDSLFLTEGRGATCLHPK